MSQKKAAATQPRKCCRAENSGRIDSPPDVYEYFQSPKDRSHGTGLGGR